MPQFVTSVVQTRPDPMCNLIGWVGASGVELPAVQFRYSGEPTVWPREDTVNSLVVKLSNSLELVGPGDVCAMWWSKHVLILKHDLGW